MLLLLQIITVILISTNSVFCQEFNSSLSESPSVLNVTEDASKIDENVPTPETIPNSEQEQEQPQADQPAQNSDKETTVVVEPTRLPPANTEASTFPPLVHHENVSSTAETKPSEVVPNTLKPTMPPETKKTEKKPDVVTSTTAPDAKKGSGVSIRENFALLVLSACVFRYFN